MEFRRPKVRAWARAVLLILLGCIPATILSFFAVPLAFSGFSGFIGGDGWINLGFGIWGLAGALGTFALWTISLGFPSPIAYLGLIVGIVANASVAFVFPVAQSSLSDIPGLAILFAPTVVAICLIVELFHDASKLKTDDHAKIEH